MQDGYPRRRGLGENDALVKVLRVKGLYRDSCMGTPLEYGMLYGGGTTQVWE
jgi:hypothetical protein